MQLHILHEKPLVKFDRQLPIFNWPYPFDCEANLVQDHLEPYRAIQRTAVARRAIYIHIPFCETICNFCPFQKEKYKSEEDLDRYVKALVAEMEIKRNFIGRCAIDTIFVGGGTPSVLASRHLEVLGDAISRNFDLHRLSEFTFEVEVKSVSRSKLQAMRDIGVNRISFGAQTFSQQHRAIFSLDATSHQIKETAALLVSMFPYTNVDLLYGTAGQNLQHLNNDLLEAVSLGTSTIDVYPINNLSAPRGMHAELRRANLHALSEATRVEFRMHIDRTLRALDYVPIRARE